MFNGDLRCDSASPKHRELTLAHVRRVADVRLFQVVDTQQLRKADVHGAK